jgi:hypothetical protein
MERESPLIDSNNDDDDAESATTGSGNYWRPVPIPNYNATTESLNYSCTVPLHANGDHGSHYSDEDDGAAGDDYFMDSSSPKTSSASTFIHLLKGYVGPGCLSLPWAVSQMGYLGGTLAIALVSFWTSYNCYTIVKIMKSGG